MNQICALGKKRLWVMKKLKNKENERTVRDEGNIGNIKVERIR